MKAADLTASRLREAMTYVDEHFPKVAAAPIGGRKMGNAHLKWAFAEAASLMLRSFAPAKAWMARQSKKRGAKKAHAILEAKIGRAVYHLWRKQVAFDAKKFLAS